MRRPSSFIIFFSFTALCTAVYAYLAIFQGFLSHSQISLPIALLLLCGLVTGEGIHVRFSVNEKLSVLTFGGGFALSLALLGMPQLGIVGHFLGGAYFFLVENKMKAKWMVFNLMQFWVMECSVYTIFYLATGKYAISLASPTWSDAVGGLLAGLTYVVISQIFYGWFRNTQLPRSSWLGQVGDIGADKLAAYALDLALVPLILSVLSYSPVIFPIIVIPIFIMQSAVKFAKAREREAVHDVLTGLPNRGLLRISFEEVNAKSRDDVHYAVMLLDLDHFKSINDSLGHQTGDKLLCEAANRLRAATQKDDLVCRLGGDEFAILAQLVTDDPVQEAKNLAQKVLDNLNGSFFLSGVDVPIQGSLGVSLYPDHGEDIEILLTRADVALYKSKEQRGSWYLYDPEIDNDSPSQILLVEELSQALTDGRIYCGYQLQYDMSNNTPIGVEVFPVWNNDGDVCSVPDVDTSPEITNRFFRLVLDESVQKVWHWHNQGHDLSLTINFSGSLWAIPESIDSIQAALLRYHFPANRLIIDVSNSLLTHYCDELTALLAPLRNQGVHIRADNVQLNQISLSDLSRLPIAGIKLNGNIWDLLPENSSVEKLCRVIRAIDLDIAFEQVNSVEQYEVLSQWESWGGQGAFWGGYGSSEEIERILHTGVTSLASDAPVKANVA